MKLYLIGLGPGKWEGLTLEAQRACEECDVLVGYHVYLDLIRSRFPDKPCLTTAMRQEPERCRMAIREALGGKTVGLVCSGDAGVYGMASLTLTIAQEFPPIDIVVVPGVTAALSGAALLGAPLSHDFAVVSLSDLLTPWDAIERRLTAAAEADFALCLYNPASHHRPDNLKKACDILLRVKSPETVCGLVRCIGGEGGSSRVLTLRELRDADADMFTTVFIGNSLTKNLAGRMVTPRGYRDEMADTSAAGGSAV